MFKLFKCSDCNKKRIMRKKKLERIINAGMKILCRKCLREHLDRFIWD